MLACTLCVSPLSSGQLPEDVQGISGTLVSDALIISGGTAVYEVAVEGMTTNTMRMVSSGLPRLTIFDKTGEMLWWGQRVDITSMSDIDGLLCTVYERKVSSSDNLLLRLRIGINDIMRGRLARAEPLAEELGLRLLLADGNDPSFPIARMIEKAGCSHLLALSGLHLMLITAVTGRVIALLAGRRAAGVASSAAVMLFVFIAGLKASLVRSAIMYLMLRVSGRHTSVLKALAAAFIVQIILFPSDADSLGFRFSYAALAGILLFSPVLTRMLDRGVSRRLASLISATAAAVIATAPLSLEASGNISAAAVPATVLLTPIIFSCMAAAIMLVLTGWGAVILNGVTDLLVVCTRMFANHFPRWEGARLPFGSMHVLIALAALCCFGYLCVVYGSRTRQRRYESGIQLRLSQTDCETARRKRASHEQTLRSEFSDLQGRERQDHHTDHSRQA
jgi:competence protein ComEC